MRRTSAGFPGRLNVVSLLLLTSSLINGISSLVPADEPAYAPRIYPEVKSSYERGPPRTSAYYREAAHRLYEEKAPYPGPPKPSYAAGPERCSKWLSSIQKFKMNIQLKFK
jgi:hypothetical protein